MRLVSLEDKVGAVATLIYGAFLALAHKLLSGLEGLFHLTLA